MDVARKCIKLPDCRWFGINFPHGTACKHGISNKTKPSTFINKYKFAIT